MPIYMKMTDSNHQDIKGDVTAKGHEGCIDNSSLTLGLAHSTSASDADGSGSGGTYVHTAPNFPPIEITKAHDGASAALFKEASIGDLATVQIDFVAQDSSSNDFPLFQSIFLDGVVVASVNVKSSGNPPVEGLSLNFSLVTMVNPLAHPPLEEGEEGEELYGHLAGRSYYGGP